MPSPSRFCWFGVVALIGCALPWSAAAGPAPAKPAQHAAAAKPAAPLDASGVVDRVQAFYDKTKTFKSTFRQSYLAIGYGKKMLSNGQVIFEKPGKMSWRYANNGNRIVSDGRIVKVYERNNKQLFEQPVDKNVYPAALSFLVGGGKLKKSFSLGFHKSARMAGGYVLTSNSRQSNPAFEQIVLFVDGQTFQVRRVVLLDAQRNRNTFEFDAPVVNTKPPSGEFEFTAPPGTQVIRP